LKFPDDLIDTLIGNSSQEVRSRHPGLSQTELTSIANSIAVSALRYFLLKYTRNSVIAFDLNEALSFEGETGPYIQYAMVRGNNILKKVQEADPSCTSDSVKALIEDRDHGFWARGVEDEFWSLVYLASQLESNVQLAVQAYEPATLARYLFTLAQTFNLFYHKHRIISEPDPSRKRFLLALTRVIRDQLAQGLTLLGITVPERM
jgi:arginyl-tRNA synthetase